MPRSTLAPTYLLMSMVLLVFTGGGEALLAENFARRYLPQLTSDHTDRFQEWRATPIVVGLTSWLGWATSFLLMRLGRWGRIYTPLILHPSAILLTVGGYGWTVAALLGIFISIERILKSRTYASVAALGLGLGGAALTVPGFPQAFLTFAAPLILVAPRLMLERHLLAFILVALLPAATIVAISFVFEPSLFSSQSTPPPAALLTLTSFIPAAGLIVAILLNWRVGLTLGAMSVGVFIAADSLSLGWSTAMPCFAAAFALHRRASVLGSLTFAAACVLAAAMLARQMSGV